MHTQTMSDMYKHTYIYTTTYTRTHTAVHVYTPTHLHTRAHTHMHTHTYAVYPHTNIGPTHMGVYYTVSSHTL